MQYGTRPVLGVLLATVLATHGLAEETKAPWWHFGHDQDAPSAPATVTPAPTLAPSPEVTPIEDESWLHWPSMPKVSWFKADPADASIVTDPTSTGSPVAAETSAHRRNTRYGKPMHTPRPRNTWAQPAGNTTAADSGASPWKAMTESTRTAWHKTVDFVTPGDGHDAPVVSGEARPSWWHRMWHGEEADEGPQTVTEWMAQDRLDP
jgi:hypothetical protein